MIITDLILWVDSARVNANQFVGQKKKKNNTHTFIKKNIKL